MTCPACNSGDHNIVNELTAIRDEVLPSAAEHITKLIEALENANHDPVAFIEIVVDLEMASQQLHAVAFMAQHHMGKAFGETSWQN